ncbi:MAG: DinB family protein [Alphaproteobacteria bacterium]
MKKITLILILTMTSMYSQKKLPFYQIPEAPNEISSTNIMVRMVQGLGFRYHWATQDLTEKDLKYRPSKDAISNFETIKHIYNLSNTIYNSTKNSTNIRSEKKVPTDYRSLRRETLNNLKLTSEAFESFNDEELKNVKIIIQRKSGNYEFPVWNLINGPISDAIYHTGQLVSFRRTSGNPIPKGVNVFLGIKK